MALLQEQKQEIMTEHQRHEGDTGSSEVQVAMLSARVLQLTEHLKTHPKDFASRRSLLKLIGQRKRLLAYIRSKSAENHRQLIAKLGIRG
ncbi:MAG TPA: 30S ribosomal protein S15 [Cyanobacteria bacterium UBA8156]|jgi:small subunit ribosomal protein S15|nr:30S ribosomal protein S15 [Cyanobacteria bacterium UBA8156]